jgi:hypothetical protein
MRSCFSMSAFYVIQDHPLHIPRGQRLAFPSRTSGPHVGRLTSQPSHLLLPFIPSTAEDVTAAADSAVPAQPGDECHTSARHPA